MSDPEYFEFIRSIVARVVRLLSHWPQEWMPLKVFEVQWVITTGQLFETQRVGSALDFLLRMQQAAVIMMHHRDDGEYHLQLHPRVAKRYPRL